MKGEDSNRRRNRGILEAGASAVVGKVVGLLANLISIPIAVRYLGPVQFGIWATISTSLMLLFVLDFGIANTLTNYISEAYAREDKGLASSYASSAFWLMVMVATVLGLVGWMAWPYVNWNYVFHVDASAHCDVSTAVAVGYVVFLVAMPAGLAAKLLGGYQELRIANLFAAGGGVGSLIAIVLVVRLHGGLPLMVGASYGAMALANGICLLWIWLYHKPWLTPWPSHVSFAVSRRLLGSGSGFFLLQIAGLIVFNSDNMVITHFLGPAEVTPYNVTWRLVSYASALQTFMLPALWPAYAEAFVRGDLAWIRKTFRRAMVFTMGASGSCCIVFLCCGQFLIRLWAGPHAVPTYNLLFWMCIWVLISTFMNNVACILVAAFEIRVQVWTSLVSVIVNLALSLWWVRMMGSEGVILGTVVSYLIILVGPQLWKVGQILNRPSKIEENDAMVLNANE
jgi:O-antigen/teichoic acid export membrane protein